MEGLDTTESEFDATLHLCENVLTVGLFRMGRMARVGCRVEMLDGDATVQVALGETTSPQVRTQVEEQVNGVRLSRDIFYPDQTIGLNLLVAPNDAVRLDARLVSSIGQTIRQLTPTSAGEVVFCRGAELPDGAYRIECAWMDQTGAELASIGYLIHKTTPLID